MKNLDKELSSLAEVIPNAQRSDVTSLIEDIETISELSKESLTIEAWLPTHRTVIEIIKLGLPVNELINCIEDFKNLAKNKDWEPKDNLDAKLITHIKILANSNRIKLTISE